MAGRQGVSVPVVASNAHTKMRSSPRSGTITNRPAGSVRIMCACGMSWPLMAKLPGGAFVARFGPTTPVVFLTSVAGPEPAVRRGSAARPPSRLRSWRPAGAGRRDAHSRRSGRCRPSATLFINCSCPVRAIDGEGADGAGCRRCRRCRWRWSNRRACRGIENERAGARVVLGRRLPRVSAPVARSTRKMWMPRPLPGGRSTLPGGVSTGAEL